MPFVTGWMGENHFAAVPTALYGCVLFMSAVAYYLLVRAILAHHGRNSRIAEALGNDFKGKISAVMYVFAVPLAFVNRWLAYAIYVAVAMVWFIPDRRIERTLNRSQ